MELTTSLASEAPATREAYLSWAAAVKALGGVATAYPYHGTLNWRAWSDVFSSHDTYGAPAARFPYAVIYRGGGLNPAFDREPDQVSTSPAGNVGFYLAPPNVIRYTMSRGGMLEPIPGVTDLSPNAKPKWYDDLVNGAKWGTVGIVGLVALGVLSYLPRRRA